MSRVMAWKIIKQYAEESTPKKRPNDFGPETVEKWRKRAEADVTSEITTSALKHGQIGRAHV